jgi:hypothetical protein
MSKITLPVLPLQEIVWTGHSDAAMRVGRGEG